MESSLCSTAASAGGSSLVAAASVWLTWVAKKVPLRPLSLAASARRAHARS